MKRRATRDVGTEGREEEETDMELVESVVGKDLRVRWVELRDRRRAEIG